MMTIDKMSYRVHRLACQMRHGNPPTPRHLAAHVCGSPSCFNPNHVRWATDTENAADRFIHGSGVKLTPDLVRQIRESIQHHVPHKVLAERFGVSAATISHVVTGRRWSEVV